MKNGFENLFRSGGGVVRIGPDLMRQTQKSRLRIFNYS